MDKKLKASNLTWSGYGWWCRRPDGSRYTIPESIKTVRDENS